MREYTKHTANTMPRNLKSESRNIAIKKEVSNIILEGVEVQSGVIHGQGLDIDVRDGLAMFD